MSWGVRVSVWKELHSLILLNAQFQIRDFHLRFTLLFKLLYYCLIIILNPYSLFPLIFGVHSNKKQLNVFDWMFLESFAFRHSVLEESKVFGGAFSPICLLQRLSVARRPALRPWQRDQHYHQVRIRRVLKFKVVIECCRISIVKPKEIGKSNLCDSFSLSQFRSWP